MNDAMIKCMNVSFKYISNEEGIDTEKYVLKNVNLEVKKGEFLVVLGHINTPLTDYIYLFHMPFFFFISGFLYNEEKVRCDSRKEGRYGRDRIYWNGKYGICAAERRAEGISGFFPDFYGKDR